MKLVNKLREKLTVIIGATGMALLVGFGGAGTGVSCDATGKIENNIVADYVTTQTSKINQQQQNGEISADKAELEIYKIKDSVKGMTAQSIRTNETITSNLSAEGTKLLEEYSAQMDIGLGLLITALSTAAAAVAALAIVSAVDRKKGKEQ